VQIAGSGKAAWPARASVGPAAPRNAALHRQDTGQTITPHSRHDTGKGNYQRPINQAPDREMARKCSRVIHREALKARVLSPIMLTKKKGLTGRTG